MSWEIRDKLETAGENWEQQVHLNKDEEEKKKLLICLARKSDICIDTIGSNQTIASVWTILKTGTIAVYGLKAEKI
ncbi:MAG: hypothetical protein ACLSEY_14725 [Enterocloster sp.]